MTAAPTERLRCEETLSLAAPSRPVASWRRAVWQMLLSVLLASVACAGPVAGTRQEPPGSTTVTIQTRDGASFVLADPRGLTLYYFVGDDPDHGDVRCEDACTANWTPLSVSSTAVAKPEALPATLDTVKRRDGSLQVRYGGRPVYRFALDREPGDRKGQDIESWTVAFVELACDCATH